MDWAIIYQISTIFLLIMVLVGIVIYSRLLKRIEGLEREVILCQNTLITLIARIILVSKKRAKKNNKNAAKDNQK